MIDHFEKALAAEWDGEYEEAARLFALDSLTGLVEEDYANARSVRIDTTKLFVALSHDARAGNEVRAEILGSLVLALLEIVREEARDVVLVGLTYEWEGDTKLILGDDAALDAYREAERRYVDTGYSEPWGAEEETSYAASAYYDFIKSCGESIVEEENESQLLLNMEFKKRISRKQEVAASILS